jgi:hypothetical protein
LWIYFFQPDQPHASLSFHHIITWFALLQRHQPESIVFWSHGSKHIQLLVEGYWLCVYLLKVIDFLCTCWRLLTLCVPVEGYWLCVYLLKVIDFVCTCWSLLTKHRYLT